MRIVAALGAVALAISLFLPVAARAAGCEALPAGAGTPPIQITPVTLHVLQSTLVAAPGSDGRIHVAYAAELTNASRETARIEAIVPVDPMHGYQPTGRSSVRDMDGHDITGMVRAFHPENPKHPDARTLAPGAAGIAFFDVAYEHSEDVPRLVSHRIEVVYPKRKIAELTGGVPVSCDPPVVLSPPLSGHGWWDSNGCCETISPHRGATLPVNGAFEAPEQFAIDFVQLAPDHRVATGPVKQLASWPYFGAPVLAAADGTVVEMVNDMPEQVPGPPVGITAENAAGNHIIEDIGGGRFVLYAHLKTGSIPASLTVGGALKRGAQLGQVGNTGSTTAPHLHFQVMDRPSTLNSTGLPFVFDRQVLEGRVGGTANQYGDTAERGDPVAFAPSAQPVAQPNLMPTEPLVFGYNLP